VRASDNARDDESLPAFFVCKPYDMKTTQFIKEHIILSSMISSSEFLQVTLSNLTAFWEFKLIFHVDTAPTIAN
jgi:hypothetical protein